MRRLLGLTASVRQAAIFAGAPPAAVIPVFGLGVAAALVYGRWGVLLGPMIVHAVYNAAIITYQTWICDDRHEGALGPATRLKKVSAAPSRRHRPPEVARAFELRETSRGSERHGHRRRV